MGVSGASGGAWVEAGMSGVEAGFAGSGAGIVLGEAMPVGWPHPLVAQPFGPQLFRPAHGNVLADGPFIHAGT